MTLTRPPAKYAHDVYHRALEGKKEKAARHTRGKTRANLNAFIYIFVYLRSLVARCAARKHLFVRSFNGKGRLRKGKKRNNTRDSNENANTNEEKTKYLCFLYGDSKSS